MLTDEFDNFSQLCEPWVGSSENQNVTDPQKELLVWHWKLSISMYRIQEFIKEKTMDYSNGNKVVLLPVIIPKVKST